MEYVKLKIYAGMVYDFIYNGSVYQCINDQRYTWQQDASDDRDYRMLLSTFDNDNSEIGYARKSKHFLANPSTGLFTAKYHKNKNSTSILADTSANADSVSITSAEIAKYSTVYMSATWTERETVEFCDIIPIADIIAGAIFKKITETGTRRYTYSVTCTSAGLFTLTQSNSTGTSGTLRLKLYVI